MKKTLSVVALLAAWTLVLAWCNNTKNVEEKQISEAGQYCIDNGGSFEIVTSDTAVYWECTLADGTVCEEWDYFEGKCPSFAKKSLDLGELIKITEDNFPKAYTYSRTNIETNENETKPAHVYTIEELGFLTPEYSNIVDREVTSSGIEDGMIYTLVDAKLDDGKEINILYIVDPVTYKFVAANVEDGNIMTNYQFSYSVDSLTYADLEEIVRSQFPESNTYTITNLETEEATTGENIYHEDTPHNLANLTPEFPATTEQTLLSSGIEDGMVYTLIDVTFNDGTTGNILYINNPESLRFVAANVESNGNSINYQFN